MGLLNSQGALQPLEEKVAPFFVRDPKLAVPIAKLQIVAAEIVIIPS